MTLSSGEVTIINNEISNDPQMLGYAGQSNLTIANIMNTQRVSPNPVMVTGAQLLGIVATIDGEITPNNAQGAGFNALWAWCEDTHQDELADGYARLARVFFNAAALFDITSAMGRGAINYFNGVEVADPPGPNRLLLSNACANALYALGEYIRSVQLIGRTITEAEVAQALA